MKLPCDKCNGLAGFYDEKDNWVDCDHCDNGNIDRCVSSAKFPEHWKKRERFDELSTIQSDAMKCRDDARRLIHLNPKAADRYNDQLSKTLEKLNSEADDLKF